MEWRDKWFTPQVLIAALAGLIGGAQMMYARGAQDNSLAFEVSSMSKQVSELKGQLAGMQSVMVTQEGVKQTLATYASKDSVTDLKYQVEGMKDRLSDRLATFQAKLENVEKLAEKAAGKR